MKTKKINSILSASTLFVLLFFICKYSFAQEKNQSDKKYITVTGSAEMSIEPDEVEITVVLHSPRSEFQKHEDDFVEICKKHKIPENQLAFKNTMNTGYWNYWSLWWYWRNSSELTQTYKIKVSAKTNLLEFVKELNKNWVQNITVSSTSNKDIQIYRKEVKKEAMRMAKEKATYLLEAIDEKIGSVISVEEIIADNKQPVNGHYPNYNWYWDNPYYGNGNNNSNSNMSSNSVMNSSNTNTNRTNSDEDKLEGLSKIKLRYEVKTVFEIK